MEKKDSINTPNTSSKMHDFKSFNEAYQPVRREQRELYE